VKGERSGRKDRDAENTDLHGLTRRGLGKTDGMSRGTAPLCPYKLKRKREEAQDSAMTMTLSSGVKVTGVDLRGLV
jgi:hypothetical protein